MAVVDRACSGRATAEKEEAFNCQRIAGRMSLGGAAMTFEEVVQRFECARPSRDGGFMARCPAHEDRNPSLSISRSDDRALLFCHAGCSIDSIIAAVGLKFSDLRLNGRQTANGNQRQAQRIVATYDYTDEKGKLLYQ